VSSRMCRPVNSRFIVLAVMLPILLLLAACVSAETDAEAQEVDDSTEMAAEEPEPTETPVPEPDVEPVPTEAVEAEASTVESAEPAAEGTAEPTEEPVLEPATPVASNCPEPEWDASWIYATDSGGHMVHVFDEQGELVCSWGGHGTGPGEFDQPIGITVNRPLHPDDDMVFVADSQNGRVQFFSLSGEYLGEWVAENENAVITRVEVSNSNDFMYVADAAANEVYPVDLSTLEARPGSQHNTEIIGITYHDQDDALIIYPGAAWRMDPNGERSMAVNFGLLGGPLDVQALISTPVGAHIILVTDPYFDGDRMVFDIKIGYLSGNMMYAALETPDGEEVILERPEDFPELTTPGDLAMGYTYTDFLVHADSLRNVINIWSLETFHSGTLVRAVDLNELFPDHEVELQEVAMMN
jgi:hypothetical protein